MSGNPVDQYPGPVSFDIRVTCAPQDMPFAVEYIEDFCDGEGFGLDFLPGERLPYQHVPNSPAELFGPDEQE